ncbi:MAG: 4-coumarate--CoA ligase family protein [Actinomycetota bacterium]|nr:4-coumarate--CoA ligase family protein [Actinomycetota bacterium]
MAFSSPRPDVAIPDVPLTPFVLEGAEERGDKPALVDGPTGRTLTYARLAHAVRMMGAGLTGRGFQKGDVFALFCPNVPEYAVAFHAVSSVGGINTTVNPLYTAQELATQLDDAGARFLLTIPPFIDRALEAKDASGVEEVFVLGEAPGATPFSTLMSGDAEVPDADINPHEDLVALPYSSGTTGLSKGVMLSHSNLVANICQTAECQKITEDDVLIGVLPFFHIYGMTVVMNVAVRKGATIVTMPRFDLEEFLRILQDENVTRAYLVPPIILALAKHPIVDKYDLSNLGMIMSGAAPLSGDLASACAERLGCLVIQGYGLTETSPVTHVTPEDSGQNKPGSIGPLVPNTDARIVDVESGQDLGANETGEIWIKGPQVMKGYLNNPDATAETIADGWLRSGDIGYADGDGYFYIVDRLKELIKYKGFQVPPAELEALLLTHPAIADAAVIPRPDEEAGEVPKAFVVLRGDATPEQIIDYVAERAAPHKKVRHVEVVDEIPKSASGKILRRVLVERERGADPVA